VNAIGAVPGPACYGKGALSATVTDANLVLGRLLASAFLGGKMHLDVDAAIAAVTRLARSLGLGVEQTAKGIIRIANEHMVQALRVISIQRGMNPQDFVLTSFGGAGGLHVCALADALGILKALVPLHAGVLSAFGMLVTPAGRQVSRTFLCLLEQQSNAVLNEALLSLSREAVEALKKEGVAENRLDVSFSLALRYQGQSSSLDVEWTDCESIALDFHQLHQQQYGHSLHVAIEVVHIRASLCEKIEILSWEKEVNQNVETPKVTRMMGIEQEVSVYQRKVLKTGRKIYAPALIVEEVSTTWLSEGWMAEVDRFGHLILQRC